MNWEDLLRKAQLRPSRFEVILPVMAQPELSYVEAVIYEDSSRYWHIEGRSVKFKSANEAICEVVQSADLNRLKMLNEEAEREFG